MSFLNVISMISHSKDDLHTTKVGADEHETLL